MPHEMQDASSLEPAPKFLYKYYSLNKNNAHHRARIFTHNELYFPSPKIFNDPFDSKIQLVFDGSKEEWEKKHKR